MNSEQVKTITIRSQTNKTKARFYERFSKSNMGVIEARCGKLSELDTSMCKHTHTTRLYNPRIRFRKAFIEPGLSAVQSWGMYASE